MKAITIFLGYVLIINMPRIIFIGRTDTFTSDILEILPCSLDPSFSTKIPEERRQKGVQEILEGVRSEYQAGETLGRSYWQGRLPGEASSYIGKGTGSGMS